MPHNNIVKLGDRKSESVRERPTIRIEAIEALADYIVRTGIVSDRTKIEEVVTSGEVWFPINRSVTTYVTRPTVIDCAVIIASDPEFVAKVQADLRRLADEPADLPTGELPF